LEGIEMKAIVFPKYGSPDVLQFSEVDKPIPNENQALIKVIAASINIADWHTMHGGPTRVMGSGFSKPKVERLGSDIAGVVESVGSNVTQFKPGDEVFGACAGAFAEYAVAREVRLVPKPANSTFEEGAAIPVAAITALQGLRDHAHVKPGQSVLIDGASGGVGTFAVQIAKSFDTEVTAVAATTKLDTLRSIGADHVIDYTKEDFTKSGQHYDLILGVNGYHPIRDYRRALSPKGTYVMVGVSPDRMYEGLAQTMILGPLFSRDGGPKFGFLGIAKISQEDLIILQQLLEARIIVPVIDRRYPLSETAQAMRYIGQGHASGKLIIAMQ
jgi:NADPH:quinone reductase-like Zn-dependent oxidoreductase